QTARKRGYRAAIEAGFRHRVVALRCPIDIRRIQRDVVGEALARNDDGISVRWRARGTVSCGATLPGLEARLSTHAAVVPIALRVRADSRAENEPCRAATGI